MPRISLQRLVRLTLYSACALMATHTLLLLRDSRSVPYSQQAVIGRPERTLAGIAAGSDQAAGAATSPGGNAKSPREVTPPSQAGRRQVATIKAIAPELLARIRRPMPLLCHLGGDSNSMGGPCNASVSNLMGGDAAGASPGSNPKLAWLDPSKLSRPLLLVQRMSQNVSASWDNPMPLLFSLDGMNATAVQAAMLQINADQEILNTRLYNWPITEVIVVQVHDRIEYLYLLIDSLRRAKGIEDCLLIFSHDVYSQALNELVRSIRFARVLQIFYPYSRQVYYDAYPGDDKRDCSRDVGLKMARQIGCANAEWPDTYGHYRETKYTQTKHHWLYKMNFVFERIRALANFTGQFVFLEEDHYVVEDFLHMLRLMEAARDDLFKDVEILTLATYEKRLEFSRDTSQAVVDTWVSSFHNMGMAFSRVIWERIRPCLRSFCEYDDYNWDWSLNHILHNCPRRPFQTMVIRLSPRVFHIGECGVHHKKKVCSPILLSSKLDKLLADNIANLYPEKLTFNAKLKIRTRNLSPNGGWGDRRDRELCVSFYNSSQIPPMGLPFGL